MLLRPPDWFRALILLVTPMGEKFHPFAKNFIVGCDSQMETHLCGHLCFREQSESVWDCKGQVESGPMEATATFTNAVDPHRKEHTVPSGRLEKKIDQLRRFRLLPERHSS